MSLSPSIEGNTAYGYSLQRFLLLAGFILLARIVSLWFNNADLFFDEAQYWVWAKEPAFGYFSKPPLLAAVIGIFTAVCGDSEFCVRLASPVFHTLTACALFATAARLFDVRVGFVAGMMWLLLPAVSLSSTLISTDVPLLLCWSIALYAFVRFREDPSLVWGVILAIALGLGLNAKYAMAYFLLCTALYAVFTTEGRSVVRSPAIWLAFLAGFAALIPNILWNVENSFTTVTHTGENIGWGGGFPHFDRLAEFFGSQFGVVGPIVFGTYLIALFRLFREGASGEQKLLICFSLPVLLLLCLQAVMSKAYANWAATAFPALVILVSQLFVQVMPPVWSKVSNSIHVSVFAVIAIATAFAAPGQLPLPDERNPFNRMWGGSQMGEALGKEIANGGYTHVLSDNRKRSATLIYYLRDEPVRVLAWRRGDTPSDHFELTRAVQDQPAGSLEDAVFLYPASSGRVRDTIRASFETIEELETLPLYPGADRNFTLFRLRGYRGG